MIVFTYENQLQCSLGVKGVVTEDTQLIYSNGLKDLKFVQSQVVLASVTRRKYSQSQYLRFCCNKLLEDHLDEENRDLKFELGNRSLSSFWGILLKEKRLYLIL